MLPENMVCSRLLQIHKPFVQCLLLIRTILYYPMSTGRNIPEIIRILQSLQLNDQTHYSTPANWQPGDAVVMGAPLTIEEAQERLESSDNTIEHLDWYLTMKKMK